MAQLVNAWLSEEGIPGSILGDLTSVSTFL